MRGWGRLGGGLGLVGVLALGLNVGSSNFSVSSHFVVPAQAGAP